VQLVHGPVAASRTLGKCLLQADRVHFLQSARGSLITAMNRYQPNRNPALPGHFQPLKNGLAAHQWPSLCQHRRPVIFWAASLLEWKGLDTLLNALRRIDPDERPEARICYIRPRKTPLPVSRAPVPVENVLWHENPSDLDRLRAGASIFVSTSEQEPFGLSILEALAAGLCVVLPDDGAYWSHRLTDGAQCVMYRPGDDDDLAVKLRDLCADCTRMRAIGLAGRMLADNYRAEQRLEPLRSDLEPGEAAQGIGHQPARTSA
jgi:glycosyltransferase involved in cell wall biosynthesis